MKNIAVYKYPSAYATEHGELDLYRLSNKINVCCRDAIESAIRGNYRNNCLSEMAARKVVDEFGLERTQFVLANTVHHMTWDGRYSRSTKEWAGTIIIYEDEHQVFGDGRTRYLINSHPGLVDLFVAQVRRIEAEGSQ